MLSRLLIVRLKAAENALRDGRHDEAFRLATEPDLREHRRGSAVLAKLAEKFLERAREHFRADRFSEALIDLERARAGGVLLDEIAELEQNVRTVSEAHQQRERDRRGRLDVARRRIEGGSLAAGKEILEHASASDHAAHELRRAADGRSDELKRLCDQVETLMKQGRTKAAADRLRRARSINAMDDAVLRLETKLCNQVLDAARRAISDGKLSHAWHELGNLGDIGRSLPARRDLDDALRLAKQVAGCLKRSDYAEARRHALSLQRLVPDAKWVRRVSDELKKIDDALTALAAGPLGDLSEDDGTTREPLEETVALPARAPVIERLPDRLLLLVDGGGSYLLLRSDRVSLGRVASSKPADVPFFGDVAERHANVNRVDDDYFLFADKDVEVGGRPVRRQLLRDGDRIVLARRAKVTFRMPSRRSASAVLDLSDTTKMPNDVRRVVLFHRHAILGAGSAAHIACRHAGPPLVLFDRHGSLWIRQKNDGHVDAGLVELRLGEPVEVAGVSLVLRPWEVHGPGMLRS